MNIVIGSGYFDPLHPGHIDYIKKIVQQKTTFYIIVNNDKQAELKKGKPFMNQQDRMTVVSSLEGVKPANVILSIDEDTTVSKTIEYIVTVLRPLKGFVDHIYFVKGGDRKADEIPEAEVCRRLGVTIVDKGFGDKIRHSSEYVGGNSEGTK